MPKFFHVAPLMLEIGSVILPGNFGRIVQRYNPSSVNFDILTRETIFEQIRQQEFKEKPSRLHCIFLLETLEEAIRYRNQFATWNLIYEVSVDCEKSAMHRGSFSFNLTSQHAAQVVNGIIISPPNILQRDGYYNGLPELARTYWSTNPTSDVEILIDAPATIITNHN